MSKRSSTLEANGHGLPPDEQALIAERAYFKAEQRGFEPGYELDDWLAAERELAATAPATKRSRRRARAAA
jgi:hypothetical protein